MMQFLSSAILPGVLIGVLIYGMVKKVDVFDCFLSGASEGIKTSFSVLPALVALMTMVAMLRSSGFFDLLAGCLAPFTQAVGLPGELLPLAVLRPISGSGALAMFQSLLGEYGPDSTIGRMASVMMGSTETTFYTIAVYYSCTAVKIKKTHQTLPAALTADLTGFLMSVLTVRMLLGN